MLDDLERLIIYIEQKYKEINLLWKSNENFKSFNQKKILVKELDSDILNVIFKYRQFINDKNDYEFKIGFDKLKLTSKVNSRVKALNSIEYKINKYNQKEHENGNIPVNKCLNDLLGIRIILNHNYSHKEIENFVKLRFNNKLKCINAQKGDYIATHIYFKKDNYNFEWELQVWSKANENKNIKSHEKYKQDYAKWELENRGGVKSANTLYNNE